MSKYHSKLDARDSLPGFAGLLAEEEGCGLTAAKTAGTLGAPMYHQVR